MSDQWKCPLTLDGDWRCSVSVPHGIAEEHRFLPRHVWREVELDHPDDPELMCAGCYSRASYGAVPDDPCLHPVEAVVQEVE